MERKVKVNIDKLLQEYNLSLRELSRLTNIRHAVLSELKNGKRSSMHFSHIEKIANALNIDSVCEIMEFEETVS
ncbi:helix-turn-helix domain-containing protein [Mesobacillus zeae]|uniref:XRE family transcriptional regulator n=1 Tax=Mesobacillus zeae TaxID=1917180 RepID=A0A398B183_9BACI|nr:helix-turn-helix transcriptional regulator [Mesobacillus zeae]RID82658.1 XRE family transcriptional regulator [Mesobacillus zeae]